MKGLALAFIALITLDFLSCAFEREDDIYFAYLMQRDNYRNKNSLPYSLSVKEGEEIAPKDEPKPAADLTPQKVSLEGGGGPIPPSREAPLSIRPPQSAVIDNSQDEPLPEIITESGDEVVHPEIVNHYNDIHRYQNHHHHHNTHNVYNVHHRYQTRVFNHPSSSQSFSETGELLETGEFIPPVEYTMP